MSVSTDFRDWLVDQSSITDLVGQRVCQAFVDQTDEVPYILFRRSGASEDTSLAGERSLETVQFDVECRGKTLDEAEAISDALAALVDGFKGTWNGRRIQAAFVTDQNDDYEPLPVGKESPEQIVSVIVRVFSD